MSYKAYLKKIPSIPRKIVNRVLNAMKNREIRKISFSNRNNIDGRYYIIRRKSPGAGFFSNYLYVLGNIYYAIEQNWIPVVDMEHYTTLYHEKEGVNGIHNDWEYYFKQPKDACLSKAYQSKNYILSDFNYKSAYKPFVETENGFSIEAKGMADCCAMIEEYVQYQDDIQLILEDKINANIVGNVLGVHVRGTDKRHYNKYHYISCKYEDYFNAIDELLKEMPIDTIMLCTDEKEAVLLFSQRYGDRLKTTDAFKEEIGSQTGLHCADAFTVSRKNHKYLLGLEVIIDMEILANCQYLIHGHSNVTNVSIIKNNGRYLKRVFVG